jgi:hypothetical protein
MEGAVARLEVLARQIAVSPTSASSEQIDVAAMQRLLEHDNWETRQKMKDLMDGDLFVPCASWLDICNDAAAPCSALVASRRAILTVPMV